MAAVRQARRIPAAQIMKAAANWSKRNGVVSGEGAGGGRQPSFLSFSYKSVKLPEYNQIANIKHIFRVFHFQL